MISDEPDEDADALDDETLLDNCTGTDPRGPRTGLANGPDLRGWPPSCRRPDARPAIDAETLAWFKASRTDWRAELDLALRAWAVGQTQPRPGAQPND
jgi:hypothetical protein